MKEEKKDQNNNATQAPVTQSNETKKESTDDKNQA